MKWIMILIIIILCFGAWFDRYLWRRDYKKRKGE